MTTNTETFTCEGCDRQIDGIDLQGIIVVEGGSIPGQATCADCLAVIMDDDPERAAYLIDCAEVATLHSCVEHAVPAAGSTAANRWADCDLCGVVLENCGDAYALPEGWHAS